MPAKKLWLVIIGIAIGLLICANLIFGWARPKPVDRVITIEAEKYAYTPSILKVNKGDRITLILKAKDVTHGFFLEGYDINAKARPQMPSFWFRRPSTGEDFQTVNEIHFTADQEGKFRYRCSTTCGYMHPFMQGELVVEPNRLYPASVQLAIAIMVLSLLWFARGEER